MTKLLIFKKFNRWVNKLSLNALENAYEGALSIQEIEDKHFEGKKIAPTNAKGKSIYEYFQSALESQLLKIRFNLTQVKVANFFNGNESQNALSQNGDSLEKSLQTEILDKLSFIESVISKYRDIDNTFEINQDITTEKNNPRVKINKSKTNTMMANDMTESLSKGLSQVSPGGFLHTAAQIRRELSPEYEQEVVNRLRYIRRQERKGIIFLIVLLLTPVIVQFTTKNLIFQPLVDYWDFDRQQPSMITLAGEFRENALTELAEFRESLEFDTLVGIAPEIPEAQKEKLIQEKAREIFQEYGYKSLNGTANILADICSFLAFCLLMFFGRNYLIALKGFLDRFFKGLNDVTKVFVFILFTDMFVGFHSPEGWEVILNSTANHFGLPESETFNNVFIATIPVIMDTIFKLLIFNYLTRKSPATVAVYEKMNQ